MCSIDEAALASNSVDRSWAVVARPFIRQQLASYFYVLLAELATVLFGVAEYSLAVLPALALPAAFCAVALASDARLHRRRMRGRCAVACGAGTRCSQLARAFAADGGRRVGSVVLVAGVHARSSRAAAGNECARRACRLRRFRAPGPPQRRISGVLAGAARGPMLAVPACNAVQPESPPCH